MRIGASLVLIAIGAILRFAVSKTVSGISLHTVGVVLMIVGAIGLLITLAYILTRRDRGVLIQAPGATYVTPADPVDPRY